MKPIDSIKRNTAPKIQVSDLPQPQNSISLLSAKQKTGPKKILKRVFIGIVIIIFLLGGTVFIRAANLSQKIFVGQKTTFFGKLVDFLRGDRQILIGENLGQINVLLLGVGGEGHDGPYLTDTMILAQIRPDIGEITLTSVPRDYLAQMPENNGELKINSAFSLGLGKDKDWNRAGQWARQVVENISGLTIPYFAVIDFSGFEKAVNQVGGVDVNVERAFTDFAYPDSGTGYLPPQTFTAGPQHMDGARALIFARSRHAAGPEGSDFARSQRQQKIIDAFKEKVLSLNLISDAAKINSLLGTFADHFHTNMSPSEMFRIYSLVGKKAPDGSKTQILSLSLDLDTHIICNETLASNGAYVLVPCRSAEDVTNFFKNSFAIGKLTAEKATVWLASSTGDKAAYDTAFRKLTDAGIVVYNLSYSKDNLPQTLVYQVDSKPATAEFINNELNATSVSVPPPGVHIPEGKVDVIVILGQNAPNEPAPPAYIPPPARVDTTTPASNSTTTPATSTRATHTKN